MLKFSTWIAELINQLENKVLQLSTFHLKSRQTGPKHMGQAFKQQDFLFNPH